MTYPVGAVYISFTEISPATLFGGTTNLVMNGTGFLVLSLHITAHSNGVLAVSVNGKTICNTQTVQSGASSEVNYWSIIPLYLSSGDKVTITMDTNSTNSSYRIYSRF